MTTSSSNTTSDNRTRAVLFAGGERWGWERRAVERLYRNFSEPAPTLIPLSPPRLHAVEDRHERAQQTWQHWNGRNLWIAIAVIGLLPWLLVTAHPVALVLAVWALGGGWLIWYRSRVRALADADAAELHNARTSWETQQSQVQHDYDAAEAAWTRAREVYSAMERERVAALPIWGAVRPLSRTRRVDVYGGTDEGWQTLVTTLGASLLGSNQRLFILDFSEADVPALFWHVAQRAGYAMGDPLLLPHDQAIFDVFAGVDVTGIKDILVEALNTDSQGTSSQARSTDELILGNICSILAPRVTLERIDLALRVLLGAERPPVDVESPITESEWTALSRLFSNDYRRVMTERFVAMEAHVHQLRALGKECGENMFTREITNCDCISISREGTTLLNQLLVDLLVQWAIRRLRTASPWPGGPDVVMVIGADDIRRRDLETLANLAARQGIRLIYLFRRLREDGLELAGSGSSVAVFMRLVNSQEAEHAATFIGREFKFVVGQRSITTSTTETVTWTDTQSTGESQSEGTTRQATTLADQLLGGAMSQTEGTVVNTGVGRTEGKAVAQTEQDGTTEQRVHEYVLEPEVMRTLPPTHLILVEFPEGGRPFEKEGGKRVVFADCDPRIATQRRVSPLPITEVPQVAGGHA